MPYICDKCQYQGYGKFNVLNNFRIPIAALFPLSLLGYFADPRSSLEQHYTSSYVLTIASFILISVVLLLTYYRSHRYSCPKCKYGRMIKPKSENTNSNNRSGVLKLCTICNHIGREIRKNYLYAVFPIFFIISGLIFFTVVISFIAANKPSKYFFETIATPFVYLNALYALLVLTVGIYTFETFWRGKDGCPNCKNRQTMIPLDTPAAQELIKEHNLTVPTSTIPETNPNPE